MTNLSLARQLVIEIQAVWKTAKGNINWKGVKNNDGALWAKLMEACGDSEQYAYQVAGELRRVGKLPKTSFTKAVPVASWRWSAHEIQQVAQQLVNVTIARPLAKPLERINEAIKVLPAERQKVFTTVVQGESVVKVFENLWLDAVTAPAPVAAEVVTTVVEVVRIPTIKELLPQLTTVSLKLLLAEREEQERRYDVEQIHRLLGTPVPKPAAQVSIVPVEPHHRQRLPRVVVVGPLDREFAQIRAEIEKFDIKVDMRECDKENSPKLPPGDFAILNKFLKHRWWNKAVEELGKDRVFFVDHGGVNAIVQKLRDIASMKFVQ